jgi:hypothetical protein
MTLFFAVITHAGQIRVREQNRVTLKPPLIRKIIFYSIYLYDIIKN